MKHLELWLFLGFFGTFFAAMALWLYFETADDRPSLFAEEHIEILRAGGAIRSDDPLFAGHERLCLYGTKSSEFSDYGCGRFNHSAIGLFRDGQCNAFSPRNVPALIVFEYEWECRNLSEQFELRIFGAQAKQLGHLLFDPHSGENNWKTLFPTSTH